MLTSDRRITSIQRPELLCKQETTEDVKARFGSKFENVKARVNQNVDVRQMDRHRSKGLIALQNMNITIMKQYLLLQCFHPLLFVHHLCPNLFQFTLESGHSILCQVDVGFDEVRIILRTANTGVGVDWNWSNLQNKAAFLTNQVFTRASTWQL